MKRKASPPLAPFGYLQSGLFSFLALLAFLFGLLNSTTLQAQGVVYGNITDKSGKPISDVKVSISKTKKSVLSKENGYYELVVPSDTTIIIEFSHVSFDIILRTVNLKKGERRNENIAADGVTTMSTVVIEDKVIRTVPITVIPIADIQIQTGANQGEFNKILYTHLGVQQSNELSSAYSVRGGNFDENLVYVNDIEVYRPFLTHSGQQEGLSFVNGDMVSSIHFSSGGFEARYGDKMSSVLDIRYTKPREFAGSISGGLLGGSVHLEGASADKRYTYLIGARQKSNSYVLNSLDTKGDYKPRFYDVQAYLTFNPNKEWEHGFLGNYALNKYNVTPVSRKSSFGTVNQALQLNVYFDGQEIDDYQTVMSAYTTTYRPYGKDLSLKLITSVFRTQESETFDLLGQYFLDELENDFGDDNFGQSSYNLGTGGFLNHARNYLDATVYNAEHKGNKVWKEKKRQLWWGAKFQHEAINDRLSEWTMVDSAGYSLPNNPDSAGFTDPNAQPYEYLELNEVIKTNNRLSSNRYSGFVQHAWNWDSKDSSEFTLTAGLRSCYWDLNKEVLFSPRATLAWKPNWKRDMLFKFSSGYYYQPPFYRELRDFSGNLNTNLKAQRSIHAVAGTDYNYKAWGRPFKFISELYYKHLDNIIPYEIDNVRIRYYANNNAKGYATGLDMKVNGQFVKGVDSWFSMSVMKTMEDILDDQYYIYLNSDGDTILPGYTSNYIATDSILVQPGYIPRPTDQRVTFGLFFQDHLPKLPRCKMHMNLLFGSGLPFGPPSLERYKDVLRMPSYRRVDIGFSYEIVKEKKDADTAIVNTNAAGPDSKETSKEGRRKFGYKSIWFSVEVYNLLAVNNVVSYFWVRDVTGRQYAVPNYLSNRLLNLRAIVKF